LLESIKYIRYSLSKSRNLHQHIKEIKCLDSSQVKNGFSGPILARL